MPTITSESGRTYSLGRIRTPKDPSWVARHALRVAKSPDPTKPYDISQYTLQPPLDQGDEGSCTAHAYVLAQWMAANIAGMSPVLLCRMLCYYLERVYLNTFPEDSGADIEDGQIVDQQNGGLCTDNVWPYDANPSEKPSQAVLTATKYNFIDGQQPIAPVNGDLQPGMLAAIAHNPPMPVNIGINLSQADINAYERTGVLPVRPGTIIGGHDLEFLGSVPADSSKPDTGKRGLARFQNSWGASSPARTDLVATAHAGDVFIPWERFANGNVSDATAFVPTGQPAILHVAITPPTSIVEGQPVAFAATVTGAPSGTQVALVWDFGDGSAGASGATASHMFATAGSFVVTATVSVATTGAIASASVNVTVGASPGPPPAPPPAPGSDARAIVDAEIGSEQSTLASYAASDRRNAPYYAYASEVLGVAKQNIDAQLEGAIAVRPPVLPKPSHHRAKAGSPGA